MGPVMIASGVAPGMSFIASVLWQLGSLNISFSRIGRILFTIFGNLRSQKSCQRFEVSKTMPIILPNLLESETPGEVVAFDIPLNPAAQDVSAQWR
jgi:hypothetical protein